MVWTCACCLESGAIWPRVCLCGWRALSVRVWGASGVFGGCARAGAWWVCGCLRVWVCFWRVSVVLRVCVGRVDKWKRGGGGLSAKGGEGACQRWFPLLLFFSSLLWSGWRVSNPLPSPWGGGVSSAELRCIERGARPAFVGCVFFVWVPSYWSPGVSRVSWSASALASKCCACALAGRERGESSL